MDLLTLAKTFPDMCVTIRLRDLLQANEALVRQVRDEADRERRDQERRFGDALVPLEEARAILANPDPSTLGRWEKAGYLCKVKIGGKVFYRKSSIDAIINKHSQ